MLQPFFFILGLVSACLIFILAVRKNRLALFRRIGWTYLLLSIPGAHGVHLVVQQRGAIEYGVFLGIFLAFLFLEGLYDYVAKTDFRRTCGRTGSEQCANLRVAKRGDDLARLRGLHPLERVCGDDLL